MAALQCEFCGGKLITKAGGICECDSCGMEFDKTWVKEKIQEIKGTVKVEGTVDVKGTVKIEGPIEVKGINSAASLVHLGNMALEDEEYEEAEIFFDKALKNEPQNAWAYLGKFLSEEGYVSLEEFKENYLRILDEDIDRLRSFSCYKKSIPVSDKIRMWTEEHQIALTEDEILQFLHFDLEYSAIPDKEIEDLRQQLSDLKNNKMLSKAIRFGKPEPARSIRAILGSIESVTEHKLTLLKNEVTQAPAERNVRFESLLQEKHQELKALSAQRSDQWKEQSIRWAKIREQKKKLEHLFTREIAVRTDGTIQVSKELAKRIAKYDDVERFDFWEDVIAVYSRPEGSWYTYYGLRSDGKVYIQGGYDNLKDWTDIVDICVEPLAGLRSDGTVVVKAMNEACKEIVSGWKNIVALYTGEGPWYNRELLGLCADGSVVTTSKLEQRKQEIGQWKDIVDIVVCAHDQVTLGLSKDGCVVVAANYDTVLSEKSVYNKHSIYEGLKNWSNLVSIHYNGSYSCGSRIFGIRGDGSVMNLTKYGCEWRERKEYWNKYTDVIDMIPMQLTDSEWERERDYEFFLHSNGIVSSNFSDGGTGIVAIFKDSDGIFALKNDGTILGYGIEKERNRETFKWEDTRFARYKREYADWKLFDNAETLDDERKHKKQIREWCKAGLCQHCGGQLKGLFSKKCTACGKPKDY